MILFMNSVHPDQSLNVAVCPNRETLLNCKNRLYSKINITTLKMKTNIKSQQDYINLLKAIRNKDMEKLQSYATAIDLQVRQIVYDIRDILIQNIRYSKDQIKLKHQLDTIQNERLKAQKIYENKVIELQKELQTVKKDLTTKKQEIKVLLKQHTSLNSKNKQMTRQMRDLQTKITENLNHPGEHKAFQEKQNLKEQLQERNLKIQELQRAIQVIAQQKQLQRNQLIQAKLKNQQALAIKTQVLQANFKINQSNTTLKEQLQEKKKQINLLQIQIAKGRFTQHLFTSGDIFGQNQEEQRLQLLQKLESYVRPIKKTKLIYKYDTLNKVNFHRYIDDHKHIVLVVKTLSGKVIAAYSEQCFNSTQTKVGKAYLMALWNKTIYQVLPNRKGITYNDYHLVFGNQEIRIRSLELKFYSKFGLQNAHFNTLGDNIEHFVGQKDRQIAMQSYQVYRLQFE